MTSDLLDIIYVNYCDGDVTETIIVINEMVEAMLSSKRFAYLLQEECEEFALKHNKCPKCADDLVHDTYKEYSEYLGREVSEVMYEYFCKNGCCIH